jgi:hypothetical protein
VGGPIDFTNKSQDRVRMHAEVRHADELDSNVLGGSPLCWRCEWSVPTTVRNTIHSRLSTGESQISFEGADAPVLRGSTRVGRVWGGSPIGGKYNENF